MDKNTITGFILIGVLLFGFTWYQSKQYKNQVEYQQQQDSLALASDTLSLSAADSAGGQSVPAVSNDSLISPSGKGANIYKDALLDSASSGTAEYYLLSNDKFDVAFTTKGAQPYSVRLRNYRNYDSTDLYVFKPGMSQYGVTVYTGENINTKDFVFDLTEKTDTSLVMRLPFSGGGYIQQKYVIHKGSYVVDNELSFVGMENVIPRNVSVFDIDWSVIVPRMEKGYKNEVQYSKLDFYFPDDKKPVSIGRGRNADKRIDAKISWFAFQQQFFSAIMRAKNNFMSGNMSINFYQEDDESHNLMACKADLRSEFKSDSKDITVPYEFYFGPNHFSTLKSYGHKYEKIIPLGGWLVGWFTRYLIIPTFNFLHRYIANFGLIILLMTLFIKLIVSPLTFKSYKSSAMMQAIKPEIDKLNAKYPKQEDAVKKQQATMTLYKRAGISPMGGCLPMLLQFPILWAMFRFFPASIELRQQSFLWADDLSSYDSILNFGTHIPLVGNHISLFALLMAVSMFIYSKMNSSQMSSDPNMAGMKFMSIWMMPVMMFFICNSLSSGLSYYYLLSNIIMMIETWVVKKFFINQDAILAKLKASEGKVVPKSKWQQRLEEAQKMQKNMLKEQEKKRRR
ncbi:MAG: membrane protein insertase YidC [Bacteroidales bacterium]|jgi:YidC/Oxa1 family membrane protein insertase|nr:membrane protein insertase YidC [Bacteroidales bacterium]MCI1786130.1 membrane protein insertase YidC [Bacteroidales bacterium]